MKSAQRLARRLCLSLALAGLFGAASASASDAVPGEGGQFASGPAHVVHYAALNSLDIPANSARALGVRRSGNRALLVLNAQAIDDEGVASQPVPSTATGRARNLLGQDKGLRLRPVEDRGVWYVLADFSVYDNERIRFELEVTPEGAERPVTVRFEQTFYRGG